jgi:hypothetical protein
LLGAHCRHRTVEGAISDSVTVCGVRGSGLLLWDTDTSPQGGSDQNCWSVLDHAVWAIDGLLSLALSRTEPAITFTWPRTARREFAANLTLCSSSSRLRSL